MRAVVLLALAILACNNSPSAVADAGADAEADAEADAWVEPPGLLAHYPLDDISGGITSMQPGFDGACTPCPAPVAGHIGGALQFDGTAIGTLPPTVIPAVFSVALWVRVDARTPDMVLLAKPHAATTGIDTLALRYEEETELPSVTTTPDGFAVVALKTPIGRSFADAAWHHLAVTYDGFSLRVYTDGALFGARATSIADGMQAVVLGHDIDAGVPALGFVGALDELRFYERALSPDEVAGLAAR